MVTPFTEIEENEAEEGQEPSRAEEFYQIKELMGFFGWWDQGKKGGEAGGRETNRAEDSGDEGRQ